VSGGAALRLARRA